MSFIPAFACGYATGTYFGLMLEERIGLGCVTFRVFTLKSRLELISTLSKQGCGATLVHGEGSVSEIDIIDVVIARKDCKYVENIIVEFDPKVFYLMEDARAKQRGRQPLRRRVDKRKLEVLHFPSGVVARPFLKGAGRKSPAPFKKELAPCQAKNAALPRQVAFREKAKSESRLSTELICFCCSRLSEGKR